MNPRLQAYLPQCIDHDEITVDQGERSDKAVIDNLRRQLETAKSALEAVPDHGITSENGRLVIENVNTAYASVTDAMSKLQALQQAILEARSHLSNWVHGGAQYNPDLLAADSVLRKALEGGE